MKYEYKAKAMAGVISYVRRDFLSTVDPTSVSKGWQFTEDFIEWAELTLIGKYSNNSLEIYFEKLEDYTIYIMTWLDELPVASVLLPIIRNVMPMHIANQIIGVQPMTGPVGQVHTLNTRYSNTTIQDDTDDTI